MSRVFWDSMLFIFLLEGNVDRRQRMEELVASASRRRDYLFTSHFVLGEVLAGAHKAPNPDKTHLIRDIVDEMGFTLLPFDARAVDTFSRLRAVHRVAIADSINLACAASVGMDLFLTHDKDLRKLHVPAIQFIADIDSPIL